MLREFKNMYCTYHIHVVFNFSYRSLLLIRFYFFFFPPFFRILFFFFACFRKNYFKFNSGKFSAWYNTITDRLFFWKENDLLFFFNTIKRFSQKFVVSNEDFLEFIYDIAKKKKRSKIDELGQTFLTDLHFRISVFHL